MWTCVFRMHKVRCSGFMFANLSVLASKVTEISKISVVMYVSDHFVYGKLQLTEYWGVC